MRGNGGWFAIPVPVAKLLLPELSRENLFGSLKAPRDFGVRNRQHLAVAEAVYVAHLEAVDEQPVEAGEVVGALLEGGGMSLLEVARHRARHMHWVLQPRSWPRRLKTESGYHACATHKGLSTGCGLVIPLQASRIFVDFALSDKTNRRIEP